MMPKTELYSKRIKKLSGLISDFGTALLLTNETNIGYFCGFRRSEGVMFITQGKAYLLVDFRYAQAAQKHAESCDVICFKKITESISELIKVHSINNIYFEASDLSVARYRRFKNAFEALNANCIISDELDNKISECRIVKDKSEFDKILKAQQITEKSYYEVLNYVKPGVTERKIAVELEHLMKLNGAEDISFELITITGKKTSLPHGVPSDDKIKAGDFFTMDIGSVYDGYHSDTTRTVAVGFASEEMQKIYDIVLKAQLAALSKIREGAVCGEVDKTAREVITAEGYGEFFGHATGHGVGLDIHEAPYVSEKCGTILKKGMVITDEPGIYLPEKFGVRIEDMVLVTEEGFKNFVTLPKELIII